MYLLIYTMSPKYEKLLERLGMSEIERTIYLSLLDHPHQHISDLARRTQYHRPAIYKAIGGLLSDGYIERSLLDGKRYYYHISSPDRLREKLREIHDLAERTIPEIEALHHSTLDTPILSIREGIDGIRTTHDLILASLPKWWAYCCYSSSREGEEKTGIFISESYKELENKKEISRSVITNSQENLSKKDWNRDIVAIPERFDRFDDDITKVIAGNTVHIIDYNSHTSWSIENARLARYEEKIFRLLHKLLKK